MQECIYDQSQRLKDKTRKICLERYKCWSRSSIGVKDFDEFQIYLILWYFGKAIQRYEANRGKQ